MAEARLWRAISAEIKTFYSENSREPSYGFRGGDMSRHAFGRICYVGNAEHGRKEELGTEVYDEYQTN